MSDTNGVSRSGSPRAPRVIHLPSPRRLLRPEPALLVAGLALVGAMNAPVGVASNGAEGAEAASTTQVTAAPGADSLRWFDEAERRERGDRLRAVYAVPLPSAATTTARTVGPVASLASFRVPDALWAAYTAAAGAMPASCNLDPRLLAAIGQVESGSLAGRGLDTRHRAVPAVLGPVLDGGAYASIPDTDDGRWDGDRTWDRAVGPMQFIPSTWSRHGRDADGDGVADPQDVEDAALSAAGYLCAGGRDLSQPDDLRAAILSYNHSQSYLATVLGLLGNAVPGGGVLPARDGQAVTAAQAPAAPPTAASVTTSTSGPTPSPTTSSTTTATAPATTSTTSTTASPSPSSSSPTTSASTTASPTTSSMTSTSPTASPTTSTTTSPTTSTTTSPTATTTTSSTTSPTASPTSSTATPSPTTSTAQECPTASATGTASPTGTTSVTSTATTTGTPTTATGTATATCTPAPTATSTPSPSTSSANATEKALDEAPTPG